MAFGFDLPKVPGVPPPRSNDMGFGYNPTQATPGPGGIRDMGFGINFNQGFNAQRKGFTPDNGVLPQVLGIQGFNQQSRLADQGFGHQTALEGQRQQGETSRLGMQLQGQAGIEGMRQSGDTSRLGMSLQGQRDITGMQQAGESQRLGTQIEGQKALAGQTGQAEMDRLLATLHSQEGQKGQELQTQRDLATQQLGGQKDIAGLQQSGETQRANIAAQAQTLPAMLRQQNLDRILPLLQGQLSEAGAGAVTPGGSSGPSPEISVGGVLSDNQVQQQVNAARAHNDQATAAQQRGQQGQLAGRGFASNSPLQALLSQTARMGNMGQNADQERQLRLDAAQQNAGQLLQSQQARESQFASRQQEDIARRQPYFQRQSAILQALAGLV